ncbi:MAG: hypothetical protein KAT65_05450, partial [Methanophagales archaeon]|nr:hypothetical protein [Methanophagales archaeon]
MKRKKMENKRKIALSGVIALAVLAAMLTVVPSALAYDHDKTYNAGPLNVSYFVEEHSTGVYCENNTIVQVRMNTTVATYGPAVYIIFDSTCVNITAVNDMGSAWTPGLQWSHPYPNEVRILGSDSIGASGDNLLAIITLHCINATSDCTSYLNFSSVQMPDVDGNPLENITRYNGTIDCTCTGAAGPINVDIRADGINGIIFNAPNYPVYPGTVTDTDASHTINNQTAMGAMMVYCRDNGINVDISTGTYGNWTIQIGSNASDMYNWMYAVNETSPPYAADLSALSGGEKVHWFNYMLNYYAVLTTLDKTSIYPGDDITATVTWKNTTGTYPLSGASVNV